MGSMMTDDIKFEDIMDDMWPVGNVEPDGRHLIDMKCGSTLSLIPNISFVGIFYQGGDKKFHTSPMEPFIMFNKDLRVRFGISGNIYR